MIDGHFPVLVALLAIAGLGISVFKTAALALIGDVTASSREHTRFMNTVEGILCRGRHSGTGDRGRPDRRRHVVEVALCRRGRDLPGAGGHGQRRARAGAANDVERASAAQMLEVLRDPLALGFSLLVALYVAVEVAIYVWMPTYLAGYEGPNLWLQAWALTFFFVLRAVGPFSSAHGCSTTCAGRWRSWCWAC